MNTSPRSSRPRTGLPVWLALLLCIVTLFAGLLLARPAGALLQSSLEKTRFTNAHAHDHAHESHAAASHYTCGMHPWVILPQPGDCPICHMKLVPLDPASQSASLSIDPSLTQRFGVRTTTVQLHENPHQSITAPATVTWNDEAIHDITLKYTGWVDQLFIRATGQLVRQGQLIARIDSPDVFIAQEEFLTALRRNDATQNTTNTSATPSQNHASSSDHITSSPDRASSFSRTHVGQPAASLLQASRRRLVYLGLTDSQIDELAARRQSSRVVDVFSPATGFVLDLPLRQGSALQPGVNLYRIADLSRVWVIASIPEKDLPRITTSSSATLHLTSQPDQPYQGRVDYIYPALDTDTRQARVRLVFDNPAFTLKPGMTGRVEINLPLQEKTLAIPRDAILTQGSKHVVVLRTSAGSYEPRIIQTAGNLDHNMVAVRAGLEQGQRIVTTAQFLMDSEANMRIALAQLTSPDTPADSSTTAAHGLSDDTASTSSTTHTLSPQAAAAFNQFIDHYIALSDALAANSTDLRQPAAALARSAIALTSHPIPGSPDFWKNHPQPGHIADAANTLAAPADKPLPLKDARLIFLRISNHTLALLRDTGVPDNRDKPVHAIECSMYKHDTDLPPSGQWLTPIDIIRNPYFGPMMLGCSTDQSPLPTAKVASPQTDAPSSAPEPQTNPQHHNHAPDHYNHGGSR